MKIVEISINDSYMGTDFTKYITAIGKTQKMAWLWGLLMFECVKMSYVR